MAPYFKRQSDKIVARDPVTKEILFDKNGRPLVKKAPTKETWRTTLRQLTNNGGTLFETLLNIANGHAYESALPDGRKSEPVVPSAEVRRAAAADLLHMLHGKPVSQLEIIRAEQESENMAQLAAMSDEDLRAAAAAFLERSPPTPEPSLLPPTESDDN